MTKFREAVITFLAALIWASVFVAGQSCAEGDDEKPGTVTDLNFFWRADALLWNGRVQVGDTSGLADTRVLAWRAPGEDGSDGKTSLYDVRYVKAEDLAFWGLADARSFFVNFWEDARRFYGESNPRKAGSLEQLFLPRLSPGDTVWFALRSYDEIGQESG